VNSRKVFQPRNDLCFCPPPLCDSLLQGGHPSPFRKFSDKGIAEGGEWFFSIRLVGFFLSEPFFTYAIYFAHLIILSIYKNERALGSFFTDPWDFYLGLFHGQVDYWH